MRARVADVRREAEEGFSRRDEKEKYKVIDDSLIVHLNRLTNISRKNDSKANINL